MLNYTVNVYNSPADLEGPPDVSDVWAPSLEFRVVLLFLGGKPSNLADKMF